MIGHREYKLKTRATVSAKRLAIELRKELSPPEKMVWSLLKGNKLDGLAFRTQHAMGVYVADFYCHGGRLVVEIDGKLHQGEQLEHDKVRDAWMRSCGVAVLRVRAVDVFENLDGVQRTIAELAHQRIAMINALE